MENRTKTSNILYFATFATLLINVILANLLPMSMQKIGWFTPIITCIIGIILCHKEYDDDETT